MGCKNSKIAGKTGSDCKNSADGEANCAKNEITTTASINKCQLVNSESAADCKTVCPPVELTERQKELILDSWKLLVDNIASVGVITFMRLFETHPDVQDVFMPFKGLSLEELRHSKQLRAHGLRVMGFVQKVVARIDEPEKSQQLLKELGKNHVRYGAKVEYVDLIGPQFVYAVKPSLEDKWTEEIEEAWIQLFTYIGLVMKAAMIEESGHAPSIGQQKQQSPSNKNGGTEGE